ncbi:MAG: hypothetical protein GXP62_14120, partial [Oligoflexia bacterium]|nr:hypothetical protein [Oligoflexia bacterium]
MSLRAQIWWPELVAALVDRPLMEVAAKYKVDLPRLVAALVEDSQGASALEASWWPEAQRVVKLHGIRRAARIFETTPRRIRRALARAGVRVAGQDLDGGVLPALVAVRDRLGTAPDRLIAAEAGLAVEAIQGERRRLGIAPYRPTRATTVRSVETPAASSPAASPAAAP